MPQELKQRIKSQSKPTRTPVPLSASEREEIEAAMNRLGLRTMSDFLRFAGLKVARENAQS